jgi:aminoglycoside phosphotransferase (APT) family kinase protein
MTSAADSTHKTPVSEAESAFVGRLTRALWPASPSAPALIGEGFCNWVYRVEDRAAAFALKLGKPHRAAFAAAEHRKELWCAAAARAAGVPTPEIFRVGRFEDRPYQIQAFAPGRRPTADERGRVWEAMGGWARAVHGVSVAGWGNRLAADGRFDGDWGAHLAYNTGVLTAADPLIAMGVLDAPTSADLRRRFQRLAETPFAIGLCHGDLAMFNVLVDNAGALSLIDWGCAFAAPVPHYELNEIIRSERATADELQRFVCAYGLSDETFAAVQADLPDLLALREVDTLRWALEHAPTELDQYVRSAQKALTQLR